jgi:hypothetical protein
MATFDEVEAIWVEARNAFAGREVVASTGGPPPRMDSLDVLDRRFGDAHRRLQAALATLGPSSLDDEERRGVAAIREALGWMVGDHAFVSSVASDRSADDEDSDADGERIRVEEAHLDPEVIAARPTGYADLRRSITERYGSAMARIVVGDETIDRLTAFARLTTVDDAGPRYDIFRAMEPAYRAVDGDGAERSPYRSLLRLSAARWVRDGSPVEANAARLGLAPGEFEAWLRSILETWRAVATSAPLEPWEYRHAHGAADRQLSPGLTVDRMRAVNDRHLAALGADPDRLGIVYDVEPRPGRPIIPVAFTTVGEIGRDVGGRWRPARPWVFATYATASLGGLQELIHESGHAIHYASIRTRPALFDWPEADTAFVEGIADVVGWDVDEPAWQAAYLGDAARPVAALRNRYGSVMLDICWALFEIELHREPDRRPNDVWTSLTHRYLGIVPHPEVSWWAVRGQLVDSPGYMANYAASAIIAADVRARLRDLRGEWYRGDPGWYPFLADRVLRFGATRSPGEILGGFLGRRLSPAALIDEVRRVPET